jgi:hypothetical protein
MNDILIKLKCFEDFFAMPADCSRIENIDELFSDNFIEIGCSGKKYNKEETLQAIKSGNTSEITLTDFSITPLAEGIYLLTYKAVKHESLKEQVSFRSSVWKLENNKWQIIFHQGTNIS